MTTLVTVMVLFFVMALVAAYANRNLIVEQRVAQTYQSLGIANEVNNQAVARLLSLLNSGNINDQCQLAANGAGSLRARLLSFRADGTIDVPAGTAGTDKTAPYTVVCDRTRPGDWQCQCPANFAVNLVAEDGSPRESFLARMRPFLDNPADRGRIGVSLRACSGSSATCSAIEVAGDAAVTRRLQSLVLIRALKMPPTSPVVVSGQVDLTDGMLVVHNEAAHGGVAIQAGDTVVGARGGVTGPSGTPAAVTIVEKDPDLALADDDRFFRLFFGLKFSEYLVQPAMRQLKCDGNCATALQTLTDAGAQLVWYEGDLTLGDEAVIGSVARPVVLVVRGKLTISSPLQFIGVVYSQDDMTWTNASANPSLIRGALLVSGNLRGNKGATALFDGTVVNALKLQAGSFVQLPGSGQWETSW